METFIPYYSAELIAEKSWMIRNSFSDDTEALCYLVEGRDYALLIDSILGMGNLKVFCETHQWREKAAAGRNGKRKSQG